MHKNLKSIVRILRAVAIIAIAAQFTIDIGDIPITGQTLAILALAFFLNEKEAFLALSIYLIAGFCGAPIFADGAYGLEKLFGGSGGYLIGFLVAATFISYLQNRFKLTPFISILGCTLLGTVIILIFGISRLIMLHGFEKGIDYGLVPFWKGAIIKVIIGSLGVWAIKKIAERRDLSVE